MRVRIGLLAVALAWGLAGCSGGDGTGTDTGRDVVEDGATTDPGHVPDDGTQDDAVGPGDEGVPDPGEDPGQDPDVPADAEDAVAGDEGPDPDLPGHDEPPLTRWIDPFIGTGGGLANVGSALPGATAPLGLIKASPDTRTRYGMPTFQHCAGYHYGDDRIYGFTHTHLHGTGAPDYGNIMVMPTLGMTEAKTKLFGVTAPFTHDDEIATPGYYAVTLLDPSVRVEMAATTRCAHHRYTFLDTPQTGTVVLDPTASLDGGRSKGGALTIDPETGTITGWNWVHGTFSGRYGGFPLYFTMRFDRLPAAHGTWLNQQLAPGQSQVSSDTDPSNYGAWFEFPTGTDPVVEFQVCISTVSIEGAQAAQDAEMPGWDLQATRAATQEAWEREMSMIQVEGGTVSEKIIFYTAMYHVLQMPTIWSDVDGRYQGFKNTIAQADWTYYTDMSFWDTFRTQHPLLTLVWPDLQRDMMRSLASMVELGGYVPKWPMGAGDTGSMIGQHGATVAADTWLKGVRDFDMDTLWPALKQTADGPLPPGSYGARDGIQSYLELGYVAAAPMNNNTSVSKSLEYAFNDFCLAELARDLGHEEDAARYAARANNYVHLWEPETRFFRARNADGTWVEPFDPINFYLSGGPYTEGSAWQWLWFVPHDEPGLRALFGGDEPFLAKLIEFFEKFAETFDFEIPMSWYFHGNEPDLHAPYLFIRAGRPDLTQKWVRYILDTNYKPTFDGLIGNDDAGTLSAWYVFSAVGLYPWPCVPGYYITTPIFDRATLRLPGGDLVIEAPGATGGTRYIHSATFNGEPLDTLWIEHDRIVNGGTLTLTLGDTPAP